ncbi:DUF4245 domain-containing protein [Actinomadura sp. WMMB 499]|uniref:DUF4245 domain-containing protein n=1 Tax=Actinomadura sp. WMMB 499 TaxID=1219491 RepID=UPI001249203F|nr:DUF4245 domain-containing protein [Actinomadura sp. WMMB 499]QFG24843.1 DUF4245 domain-containing protein [Actinomadura sp. WMMB 499]
MTDKTPDTETEAAPESAPESAPSGSAAGPRPIPVSAGVYKRLTTGIGGFTLAMGASLILALMIFVVTPRADEQILPTVDYGSQLWVMRNDAPFAVHAPVGLPAGWRPTSSRVHGLDEAGEPVAWHLGFVTPDDRYAALEQSDEKASEYVPRMTNSSKPLGTMQVAGHTWQKYHRADKEANSLARTLPDGVSLVVTGTAPYADLAVLAGSLEAQPKGGGLNPSGPASPSATPGAP